MVIYVIGYMCSGKTTFSKKLAKAMHYNYYDLDELFEEQNKLSVIDFFAQQGEEKFRELEQQILHTTTSLKNVVIATGGGTPCFFNNMDFMLQHGICVYLNIPIGVILSRIEDAKQERPLLKGKQGEELHKFVISHFSEREKFYNKASINFYPFLESLETLLEKIKSLL